MINLVIYCWRFVFVQMDQRITQIVAEYKGRLRSMQWVLRCSYGRGMLRRDGAPSMKFLTYLFGDM